MPSKNHHGTPFIAVSTIVSRPMSGAMPRGDVAHGRLLHRDDDQVVNAELRRIGRRAHARRDLRIPAAQAHAVLGDGRKRRAAGHRRHRVTLCGKPRAEEAADGAGTVDAGFHSREGPPQRLLRPLGGSERSERGGRFHKLILQPCSPAFFST